MSNGLPGSAAIRERIGRWRVELWIGTAVLGSCAYFFQGGGWNQNAHFATTVALIEHGTVVLDRYRASTGDLARAGGHVVSNKPIGTALAAVPAYLAAGLATAPVENRGDRIILRAHLTGVLTSGWALAGVAVLLFRSLRRRWGEWSAALVALATALATPLFPNSTMLNSHALVSLSALAAFVVLESARLAGEVPSARRLFAAGVLAGLPMTLEYMTAIVTVPLGIYAAWQTGRRARLAAFAAGCALAALVPLVHHALVFGHPLTTGYHSLVVQRFADDAANGFMGFVGPSPRRLFELTFGWCRGFFVLSPFLLASVPGLVLASRRREHRPEAVVTGALAWMVLVLVASLTYWHSGSATGSRYALLFVPFSALGVAAATVGRARWVVGVATVVSFCFMLMATSVTAIPPSPSGPPPHYNVLGWFWRYFGAGELAVWRQHILVERGVGDGGPTLPFAYNLGQLAGLPGLWALAPYLALLGWLGAGLVTALRRNEAEGRVGRPAPP